LTVRDALAGANADLRAAGIEAPALDAALLLAEVLGVNRASLAAAHSDSVETGSLAVFGSLVRRRASGECVAYILGRKEFYGLEFLVNRNVLVPRPDTETLVEAALERLGEIGLVGEKVRMLDLCTGSGAVAIAVKHEMPGLEVWATDISAEVIETARTNAGRLLPTSSIRFCQGSLFAALPRENCPRFDLITANPPYVPTGEIPGLAPEVRGEPALALDGGADGLDIARAIAVEAGGFLYSSGTLMMEADPRQMPELARVFERAGFIGVGTRSDLSGRERVIEGRIGG